MENESAVKLANLILDRPNGDPDDDLAVLSRQLLRALERAESLESQLREAHEALKRIAYPIRSMKEDADRDGARLDGAMAVTLAADGNYLQEIARKVIPEWPLPCPPKGETI
jgi:hypothetical protein